VAFTGRDSVRGEAVALATGASFLEADVTVAGDVERSLAEAVDVLGGLNALVLNAGVLYEGALSETPDEAWDAVMETNLVGAFRYAVGALPHLRAQGGGSVVAVASDAGVWPETSIGVYSVSKRALVWLAQMLAMEAGPAGIRVNAVCPGDTAPGMRSFVSGSVEPGGPEGWLLPPLGRVGTADDVAGAVTFFLSSDSAFCNGAVLLVDGGMRASVHAPAVMNG
jgi:NAD(P)-dependent dehydrogenase (short-subunit alcohol dehydrogenase family)